MVFFTRRRRHHRKPRCVVAGPHALLILLLEVTAGSPRTISLGAERRGSILDLTGTMLLAGPKRPGVGFRSEVIALVDSDTGLQGRSVWTDERGDQLFSDLQGEGTAERNRITGKFLGGTGRYAGATGSYEFSWEWIMEAEDGTIHG